MKTIVNADKILRVKVVLAKKHYTPHWRDRVPEKRRFFGLLTQKEEPAGFYEYGGRVEIDQFLKNRSDLFRNSQVLEQHSIWKKAHVDIESIGGKYTNHDVKYFDSNEKAIEFAEEIAKNFPHIQIETE